MSCQGGLRKKKIYIIPPRFFFSSSLSQLKISVNNKIACSLVCFILRLCREGVRIWHWPLMEALQGESEKMADNERWLTACINTFPNALKHFFFSSKIEEQGPIIIDKCPACVVNIFVVACWFGEVNVLCLDIDLLHSKGRWPNVTLFILHY